MNKILFSIIVFIKNYKPKGRHGRIKYESIDLEYSPKFEYMENRQKKLQLCYNGYIYSKDSRRDNKIYWRCRRFRKGQCGARLITYNDHIVTETQSAHDHPPEHSDDNATYTEIIV